MQDEQHVAPVVPLPVGSAAFSDARRQGRAMRVTWHPEAGVVVISVWREDRCVSTFRLPASEVPSLVDALTLGAEGGVGTEAEELWTLGSAG